MPSRAQLNLKLVTKNGRLELLQLFHRNRRIFLEEARSPSPRVATRLGHYGSLAEGRRPAGSRTERNRPGVRELWTLAPRCWETAQEPGVLHGRGAGSGRRTTRGCSGQSAHLKKSATERNILPRRTEKVLSAERGQIKANRRNPPKFAGWSCRAPRGNC